MTDTQLYLAIGIPVVLNAAMLTIAVASLNKRIDDVRADLRTFVAKLMEMDTRLTRIEERLEHR